MQLSDQLSSLPDVRFKPIFSASRLKIHFQEYIWFVQKIKETNLQFLIVVEFCASAIELKIGSELYSPATILFGSLYLDRCSANFGISIVDKLKFSVAFRLPNLLSLFSTKVGF